MFRYCYDVYYTTSENLMANHSQPKQIEPTVVTAAIDERFCPEYSISIEVGMYNPLHVFREILYQIPSIRPKNSRALSVWLTE